MRQRVFATLTGKNSKVVDAPLRYVYDWCTDFRSDDGKFSRSNARVRVIKASSERVVRVRVAKDGARNPRMAVELIRFGPPNTGHKDTIDKIGLDSIDYKLTAESPNKTRVGLVIVERWLVPNFPKKADRLRSSSKYRDELVAAIEPRYRSGKPAEGSEPGESILGQPSQPQS